jgi:predicted regulator of Ras-like GTPase activity (Roadblock/LC7/MglB family)
VPDVEEESPEEAPEETAEEAVAETVAEEYPEARPSSEKPPVPPAVVLEEPDMKIIGQMKKLNGIVAISVFNDDRNILLMGDVAVDSLLRIARTMLATSGKITPLLDWGSFVHMTLQIPEGNVIIAPYHDNYLCILTTRTINIGHIRRILRDLQQNSNGMNLL